MSTGASPRIATPATRAPAPSAPIITPRRSPWKCAWAAIRNSAANCTPTSVSGRDELEGEQEREVDRRHDRVERALRLATREPASTAADHSTNTAEHEAPRRPS